MSSQRTLPPNRSRQRLSGWMLVVTLLSLGILAWIEDAGAKSLPSENDAPLCRPWTTSPCLLRVGALLRSASSGNPLPGQRLRFLAGNALICSSMTDPWGRASCFGIVPGGPGLVASGYRVLFDGNERFTPASAESETLVDPRSDRSARDDF